MLAGDPGVDPQILLGAALPAEVAVHGPLAQPAKGLRIVLVQVHGLPDHIEHVAAGVVGEGEAVAGLPPGLIGLHRILQAAGLPDDGHRAIAHGDHLAQAAGLTLGGHQEQVRAGIDGHGQLLVIVQPHRHPAAVLLGGPVEELLVLPVTLAQHHQLNGELHHIMKHLTNQVQSLVGHQPAHHGHDGGVGLLPQAQHPLKHRLVLVLPAHILCRIVHRDAQVGLRIVELHVDAVEHTGELVVALIDDPLQVVGKIGHLQLVGVGGGHGGDGVGAEDGALEEVHVAVHQQRAVLGPAGVQAEQVAQDVRVEAALILDVMNGQHRADAPVAVLPHAVVLQVDGHQGGLPVVAMDDLRPELQMPQHPHHSPGEESEPLAVVHVAVELRPAEVLLVVQEIPGHPVPLQGEEAAVAVPPGQVHVVVALKIQLVPEALLDLLVQRQHHGHVRARRRQCRRQRPGHIRQSSRFAERRRLAGCV